MQALTSALMAGAHDDAIEDVTIRVRPALEATADDVLEADGHLLAAPANFGYMRGALKHPVDCTFLQVGEALSGVGSASASGGETARRPKGLVVHGRDDTTGAVLRSRRSSRPSFGVRPPRARCPW